MIKIFQMTLHEIKQLRKSLIVLSTTILLITLLVFLSKGSENMRLFVLGFADLLEKLLLPYFVYFGIKNYRQSLNNTLQINQRRSEYFLAKSFPIIMISFVVAIIITPLSYYFAHLGQINFGDFIMPVFLGTYRPLVPIMYEFGNIFLVTIISALVFTFISHLSLLSVVLYNKIGGVKLFITFIISVYILSYINAMISVKRNGADIMDRILGFVDIKTNLFVPIISISLITFVFAIISYWVVNYTEV